MSEKDEQKATEATAPSGTGTEQAKAGETSSAVASPPTSGGLTPEQLQQAIAAAIDATERRREEREARTQATQPPPPPADPFMGRDPDDLLSVKDAQALAENWLEHNMGRRLEPFQQGMQQIYNMSIGGLEAASRQEHPSVWKRWGPEVREIIERRKQTKFIDNSDYEEAISIVRGKHADELVQERLEQEMKNTMTTESTRGGNAPFGPGSRGSDDFDELPPQLLERFSRAGITREQIRKTASAMGISEERWIEMYKNGDYVFDDNKVYRKVTEDK